MKEVMAIVRINKVNATKRALNAAGITSFTATNGVLGRGKGVVDYRVLDAAKEGSQEAISLLGDGPRLVPKRLLVVVVSDNFLERTVKAIIDVNQTGRAGDGKIFVMPILEATRIRTGETVNGASGGSVLDSSGA
ncbi:MAG: P-II family nitrogen regulator [Candidatus Omnitrophica bacterium]|nr:P-II family nitrogen regulator [Candidatus Omnitrophota bacterium]